MITSYFTLRKFSNPKDRKPDAQLQRIATNLKSSGEFGRIQFSLVSGARERSWNIELSKGVAKVDAKKIDHPDFEIITNQETWNQLMAGSLAPLRAFVQGKMRVRGNLELGIRIFKKLSKK